MRLFIAINIPQEIQDYLHEVQSKLPQAKMRKTSDFHLTLKFLGSVSPQKLEEVKRVLNEIVVGAHCNAPLQRGGWIFTLDNKISFFSDRRGFIKVIWIGLKIPQSVFDLQERIEKDLKPLGFEIENRFKPHLTLARVKFYENRSFEEELKKIKVEPKEFEAKGFSLIESFLSPDGAKYREILPLPKNPL